MPLALVLVMPATSAAVVPDNLVHPADSEPVTLVTGDQVWVQRSADGRMAATVDPAPRDGRQPSFETLSYDDDLYVIPSDVVPLVPDLLDRELFNVARLLDYGYTDTTAVIVQYEHAADLRTRATPAGLTVTATLESIDAVAATISGADGWWRPGRATTAALSGVAKVWLDRPVEAMLDQSVPSVGAPDAWAAGYDGAGVTVAVLDTGIDSSHPDLVDAVVAEENFTDEPDARDEHGHGTHVAGIVAGRGTASDGTYTGVAPGAKLLNGKVCDREGDCPTSAVIAGMEWAAASGADVVNLSLGGDPSDGTDPMSQAVNALTAAHDVLFVVAAGNLGPGDGTVTTPGAADAALTVSAVDEDAFNLRSGRGPRLGDYAIKPDIRAPGVNIVSARADGSEVGPPVGDDYMALTGTSMAAPHVAGAAAILLQYDPDVAAQELKSTLATTAVPHPALDVYRQGGGFLDIPAALDAPVRATPAPLDLGYFPYPHDDIPPVEAAVTFASRTDEAVTLDLSLEVVSRDGHVPPESMLTVTPAALTVQPGMTARATVRLDVREGEFGLYGGYLVAERDGEVVSRTPVGFFKEDERYDLTVIGIAADGSPATGGVDVMDVHDRSAFFRPTNAFTNGVMQLRLPPSTYSVMGPVYTYDEQGSLRDVVLGGDPELELTADTTIVLDARQASPITIDTPDHPEATPAGQVTVAYMRADDRPGSSRYSQTVNVILTGPELPRFAATETGPTSLGRFEFYSRWRLFAPEGATSPFLYDLVFPEPGRIPADLDYVADTRELATVVNRFHGHVSGHLMGEVRHSWRPWQFISLQPVYNLPTATERTEYVVPGDTLYRQQLRAGGIPGQVVEADTRYQPGERRDQSWLRQVTRPGPVEISPTYRQGDALTVRIQEWVDSDGHWGARDRAVDTTAFRLFQDGELVASTVRPQGTFAVSPEPAEYRLELDVARDAPWWTMSTETRTAWTLQSARPAGGDRETVPLLLADYDVGVDLLNTAPHPKDQRGPATIGVQVSHQPGAASAPVGGARLWVSYDDGTTWHERPGFSQGGGRFDFVLDRRDPEETNGFLSLRLEAWDTDGNRIEQEIIRAHGLSPR